jgi:hypothetical protein
MDNTDRYTQAPGKGGGQSLAGMGETVFSELVRA